MGSMGHVSHSGASGVGNINVLFFMLVWARCGIDKRHARTSYAEHVLCIRWDLQVT
jgi:hypothetical protein